VLATENNKARWSHLTPSLEPNALWSILIAYCHPLHGLPNGRFPEVFPPKFCLSLYRIPSLSQSPMFDHILGDWYKSLSSVYSVSEITRLLCPS
jgi:hypothetical protein